MYMYIVFIIILYIILCVVHHACVQSCWSWGSTCRPGGGLPEDQVVVYLKTRWWSGPQCGGLPEDQVVVYL